MSIIKKIVIVAAIILLVGVLVLGYLGFVPGLSDIMGTNKPRDLGVKYTSADLNSINSKTGVVYSSLPASTTPEQSEKVSGSKPIQIQVTESELTAMVNDHASKWKYYPVSDVQIKIESDGSMKMSGILKIDRLNGYVQATGKTGEQVEQALSMAKTLGSNPRFYGEWKLNVVNGQVSGDIKSIQIGNIDAPQDQIQSYKNLIFSAIEGRLNQLQINAKTITVNNGKLIFDGDIPTQVALAPP